MGSREKSFPALHLIYNIVAVPYLFFIGFVVGVLAPVGAIAAMVFGVRFLTGRMPFLSLVEEEGQEERRLSLELVPAEEVGERFAEQKAKIETELGGLQSEIRAIVEKAKAESEGAAPEEA
jgi:hypothetical protein